MITHVQNVTESSCFYSKAQVNGIKGTDSILELNQWLKTLFSPSSSEYSHSNTIISQLLHSPTHLETHSQGLGFYLVGRRVLCQDTLFRRQL